MSFKAIIASAALFIGATVSIAQLAPLRPDEIGESRVQGGLSPQNVAVVEGVAYGMATPDIGTPLWLEDLDMDTFVAGDTP